MGNLEQTIMTMERAYDSLMQNQKRYAGSVAYREFLMSRGNDLAMFKSMVSKLNTNTYVVNVVSYLKTRGVDNKFLTMAQEPDKHFAITQKLKTLMSFGY